MLEPHAPARLPLVALATGLVATTLFTLAACKPRPDAPPAIPAAPVTETPADAPALAPPPVLGRAELLRAMEAAAAAYAAGQALAAPAAAEGGADGQGGTLSGRRFVVRQAFGCFGPTPAPAPAAATAANGVARWSWRGAPEAREAIELTLTPADWTGTPLMAGAMDGWEAVEGMWLARPWLPSEACPAAPPAPAAAAATPAEKAETPAGKAATPPAKGSTAAPVAPAAPPQTSPQTMGLAAVFESGGSRIGQRNGRAYSFVVRRKGGEPPTPPPGGYRLALEGRLTSFADGRAIHCRSAHPDQRPVCVAAARLDRVAFEDAQGVVLSEWRPG